MKSFIRRYSRMPALIGILSLAFTMSMHAQTITFATYPYDVSQAKSAEGVAGAPYSYDADATASDGGAITYSLRYGPSALAVDSQSGVVTWTPSRSGTYLAEIRASLVSDPSVTAEQSWSIRVTTCAGRAVIVGTVRDQDGALMDTGKVTARINGAASTPRAVVSAPVIAGSYSIEVDSGSYVLYAEGPFIPEWHSDAYDFAAATPVNMNCGDSVEVNFSVFVVRGPSGPLRIHTRAVDASSNTPLARMMPHWHSIPKWQWYTTDEQWRLRLNGYLGMLQASTNDDGYYLIEHLNKSNVIFVGMSDDLVWEDVMHTRIRQFYGFTPSILEAKPIISDGADEIFDVNILYDRTEKNQLWICDMFDTSAEMAPGMGIPAHAIIHYAIKRTANGIEIDPIHSVSTHRSYPQFWCAPSTPYEYIVFGIPHDTNYAPGFWVEGDSTTTDWQSATIVSIDSTSPGIFRTQMRMRLVDGTPGMSQLRGSIQTSGRTRKNESSHLMQTAPLAGTMIVAKDTLGRIGAYTFSNDDGSYVLKNLGAGAWTVSASKPGYASDTKVETLSGQGEVVESNYSLVSSQPAGIVSSPDATAIPLMITPNPSADRARIMFDALGGTARVVISTIEGEAVRELEVSDADARSGIDLDVSTLTSGLYLVTVSSGRATGTTTLTVAR